MPDEYDAGVMARILICEDELLFAEDLATTLRDLGYEIVGTVVTGEEAIRKAEEVRPALILMDINLAGEIDGIEAAGRISNKFDIPVVYLTAYAETDIIERANHTEPYGYVSKPVSLLQLKSTVATALYKHKADRMVRESEARFRKVFEQGPIGMGIVGTDGRFLVVNSQLCQMLGYTEDELTRLTFVDITHPDHVAQDLEAVSRLYDGEIPHYKAEKRYIKKDGYILWGDLTVAAIRDAEGKLLYTLPMVEDITDRKKAEQALRDSEERFRAIYESGMLGMGLCDPDGGVVDANDTYLAMIHSSRDDLLNNRINWRDITPPEHLPADLKCIEELMARGCCRPYEKEYLLADGTRVPVIIGGALLPGSSSTLIAFALDITDRKKVEQELQKKAADLAEAQRVAKTGNWNFDVSTNNVTWSDELYRIFEIEKTEFDGRYESFLRQVHPEDQERVRQTNSQTRHEGSRFDIEYRIITPSGQIKTIREVGHSERDKAGKVIGIFGTAQDITERKNTEEALRKSDAQKQAILDGITANLAFVNQDLEIQWVNRAAADSVGKLPSQMVGRTCHEFWADPDKPCDRCPTVKAFKTKKSEHTTMITPDGRVWDEKGEPVFDDHGKLVGVVEIAWDITERKRAEEELRQSRERLSLALEGANIGIWDWDLTTGKALWSERSLQMLGYEPEEFEPNLKNWKKLVHADDWPQVAKNFNDHIQGKLPTFEAEYRILNKSGGWQWVQGRGTVVESDANGHPVRMTGVAVDISARKEAEEALRESQERFSLAMEATQDGLWDWNMLTDDVYRSPGFFSMLGYQEEDFPLGFEGWKNLVHPDDLPQTLEALNDYLSGGRPTFSVEFRMLHKSGESVWVLSRGRVVERDATGKPIRMIGTHSVISERKKADEELRKSEARYRFLADHASDLLWTLDMNLRTTFVSPSVERVLGFTPEERMRQVVEDQLTPDSLEIARQRLLKELHIEREQGIREGKSELIDLDYYHKNGSIVCLQTAVTFIRDEKGTPIGLHGISRDITELKRSQEALRESETKYRTLFEQISSAVAVYKAENEGEDFIFVDFNRAGEEMEHVGREKLLGRSVVEVFPRVREFGLFDVFQRVWRTGVPERYPVALYRDQRIEGWRDNFVYKLPTGEIVAVYTDETERKRAEAALREREQMLTSLLSASPVGIGLASFERKMLWVNESWLSIFGFEDEHECLGMPARNLYSSEDEFARVGDLVTASMAESSIGETEARMVKKDGSVFDAHIRVNPIDPTDESKGFIAAIEDISDRKQGAEEQERLRAQLLQAQKMEAIGTLAGGIAHDFNNLLQVVLGYSELLLAEKEEDDRDYGDLQKIFQSAKSGAELVRRLLLFSRKTEPKPVPMNLNHRIVQIEKLLRRTIPKMVHIDLNLSADLPKIYADPSQMEQVLINLAVNARDAMPDVGKLTMRTASVTLDEEYCRLHVEASPGEYVLLEVADTGHGMDKETVEHIFEPFFTTKEMGRGTGLGLAMVHGIVKQHGGHITCFSEIGKGTTFKVYLPAMSTEIENVAESLAEIPTSGTETVLLVDDEDFVRELGQRILKRSGYEVLTATNGEEALDVYRRQRDKISLIILDLMMPGMGGKVCLRELLGINPETKVLIASGYSADEATKESGVVGAKGFIAKPFRFKDFLQQVRKTLDEG